MIAYLEIPGLFALLERRRNPALTGRPILVSRSRGAGGTGSGTAGLREVADCSPEAIRAGIIPGTLLRHARLALPEAAICEYDPDHYRDDLQAALDICAQFSPAVEPCAGSAGAGSAGRLLSNATFLDLPGAQPLAEIRELHARLQHAAGFETTAGLATSKLVARIISRRQSAPLAWVPPGEEPDFLAPQPIACLWTLEEIVLDRLRRLGVDRVSALQGTPENELRRRFGEQGRRLHELAFGIDHAPVQALYPPMILERALFLEAPIADSEFLRRCFLRIARELAQSLQQERRGAGRVELRLDLETSTTLRRAQRLIPPLAAPEQLARALDRLLARSAIPSAVTGLTVVLEDLAPLEAVQLDLFDRPSQRRLLEETTAALEAKFGHQVVRPARSLPVPRRERVLGVFAERS